LKDGAKLFDAPEGVRMQTHLLPSIAFGYGVPEIKGRPIILALMRIADHVSEIIEGFGPEFG
jgi:hypothetical protein